MPKFLDNRQDSFLQAVLPTKRAAMLEATSLHQIKSFVIASEIEGHEGLVDEPSDAKVAR